MDLELYQVLWLLGISTTGGLLGWIHRRFGKPKSAEYAIYAICMGWFVSFISSEVVKWQTDNINLAIMIGGGMAYYSDFALELGRRLLERKGDKL